MRRIALMTMALVSTFALLPLGGGHAQAEQQKNACTSATGWVTNVKHHSDGMKVFVLSDIQGMEAKAIIARINAMPPASDLVADHVIVLGARTAANQTPAPYVLVAFFSHDCLVTSGRADPRETADMLSGEDI